MASLSGAPSGAAGGTMPLVEHLRELRSRLTRAVLAIAVFTILGLVFYAPILNFLTHPYNEMRPLLEREGIDTQLIITGVGGAFQYQLKISLVFGLLASGSDWSRRSSSRRPGRGRSSASSCSPPLPRPRRTR